MPLLIVPSTVLPALVASLVGLSFEEMVAARDLAGFHDSVILRRGMPTFSYPIFISAVSAEFRNDREYIFERIHIGNYHLHVLTQERIENGPASCQSTLIELDGMVKQCKAVLHLCGSQTGKVPALAHFEALTRRYKDLPKKLGIERDTMARLTYTQWEAWLAVYHDVELYLARSTRQPSINVVSSDSDPRPLSQDEHLLLLKEKHGRYPSPQLEFEIAEKLVYEFLNAIGHLRQDGGPQLITNIPRPLCSPARSNAVHSEVSQLIGEASRGYSCRVKHGLGGVGKTRYCIDVANRYRQETNNPTLFLRSISADAWEQAFESLAEHLPPKLNGDIGASYHEVVDWLKKNSGWLLILDGVDDEDTQKKVIHFADCIKSGHILVSSQLRTGWPGTFITEEIRLLSHEETKTLLSDLLREKRDADANFITVEKLATLTGGLPLAISQAAAYLNMCRHETVPEYEAKLATFDESIVSRLIEKSDASAPLSRIWLMTFGRLTPPARTLLRLLSHLTDDPIPSAIVKTTSVNLVFEQACASDPWEKKRKRKLPASLADALDELSKYSLVNWDSDSSFSVHRLVIEFTRSRLHSPSEVKLWEKAVLFLSTILKASAESTGSYPKGLMVHAVDFIAEYVKENGDESLAGLYHHVFNMLSMIEASYGRLDAITEISKSPVSLLFVADAAQMRGSTDDCQAALAIAWSVLDTEGIDVAARLSAQETIVQLTFDISDVEKSIELSNRFIDQCPEPDAITYKSHSNMLATRSWAYRTLGVCDKAISDAEAALSIRERCGGKNWRNPSTLMVLAGAHDYRGNTSEACALYAEALRTACQRGDLAAESSYRYMLGWFQIREGNLADEGYRNCRVALETGLEYQFKAEIAESAWIITVYLGQRGKLPEALEHIDLAMEHEYDLIYACVRTLKGAILMRLKDPKQATEVFEACIKWIDKRLEHEPKYFESWQMRSLCHLGIQLCGVTQDYSEARSDYTKAVKLCSEKGVVAMFKTFLSVFQEDPLDDLWGRVYYEC